MPRTKRTPPSTPITENQQLHSTPDMSSEHVSTRTKRLRPDFSPDTDWTVSFEKRIMDLLHSWKNEQDVTLKKLTSDISEVKQQNKQIFNTNSEIEKSIEYINSSYESMRQLIEKLERERKEQNAYIVELEKKIVDLQQSSRSSAIEVRNIPQRDNETTGDLISTVIQTCRTIRTNITESDLRDIYRLPGKKGSNRPIVCELRSVPLKNEVLSSARAFNKDQPLSGKLNTEHAGISGQRNPIFVAEHLSGTMRQLYYQARNFAKENNFKYCWIQRGRLFLRVREGTEAIIITSMSCLQKLRKPDEHK